MAIVGTYVQKDNPEYTIEDFKFWMPNFRNYMNTNDGITMFNNLYPIANQKIFYSVFATDWKLAMSLCIAHYSYVIGKRAVGNPGDTLEQVYGGGVPKGILTGANVGGFSKSYDLTYTVLNDESAMFWNQSSYGMELMALFKSHPNPSIFVVTSGSVIPHGNPSFQNKAPLNPFEIPGIIGEKGRTDN